MQQLQNQVQRLLKTRKTQFHSAVQERTIPKSACPQTWLKGFKLRRCWVWLASGRAEVESFTAVSTLVLKLKNGAANELHLKLSDTQALASSMSADMGTDLAMRMKFVVDRWVTAINHLIK
jgi:hypothetical protein